MNRLFDVLQEFAPLANRTIIPAGETDADLAAPSLVWWNFAELSEGMADAAREAADTFQGTIA